MTTNDLISLFRPTGLKELELVFNAGMKAFPPRLPEQPIFYTVMNQEYAAQIARDWNARSSPDHIGFVLRFNVDSAFASKFPIQTVGGKQHQELWVPAEELEEFNRHIVGLIEVLEVYRGSECTVEIDDETKLPKAWARRDISVLFTGKHLTLFSAGGWEYVERCKTSGIVAILAATDQEELVMVEQFRVPLNKRVIEIPAGLAGDIESSENEALAEAAKRELLEETGYESQRMEYLTDGPSSAGLTTEVISFFRAQGLKRVSEGGGDGSEKIQIHVVPLAELESWLETKRKEGCLVDYKVYAALYFELGRQKT